MSMASKTGELPRLEIGQGRRNVISQPPASPKPAAAMASPKRAAVKKEPAGVAKSLVFAPKRKNGAQASFYLRKDTIAKLEAAVEDSGAPSRSVWLETLLDRVLS